MSSSNTQDNRNRMQSSSNQPFVVGHPVAPPGYNIAVGIPVPENSRRLPDFSVQVQAPPTRGSNNYNNVDRYRRNTHDIRPEARVNDNVHPDSIKDPGKQLCIALVFVVAVSIVVTFVVVLDNKISRLQDPKFQIDSMLVSPLNVSNSQVTAEWTIGILVSNPNKHIPIDYDKFELFVTHETDKYLCKTSVAAFRQGPKNQTKLITKSQALFQGLGDDSFASIIGKKLDAIVNFDVELLVHMRYIHRLYGAKFTTDVVCPDVKVRFSSNTTEGTMLEEPKQCS